MSGSTALQSQKRGSTPHDYRVEHCTPLCPNFCYTPHSRRYSAPTPLSFRPSYPRYMGAPIPQGCPRTFCRSSSASCKFSMADIWEFACVRDGVSVSTGTRSMEGWFPTFSYEFEEQFLNPVVADGAPCHSGSWLRRCSWAPRCLTVGCAERLPVQVKPVDRDTPLVLRR